MREIRCWNSACGTPFMGAKAMRTTEAVRHQTIACFRVQHVRGTSLTTATNYRIYRCRIARLIYEGNRIHRLWCTMCARPIPESALWNRKKSTAGSRAPATANSPRPLSYAHKRDQDISRLGNNGRHSDVTANENLSALLLELFKPEQQQRQKWLFQAATNWKGFSSHTESAVNLAYRRRFQRLQKCMPL